jgi:hypothetical protein
MREAFSNIPVIQYRYYDLFSEPFMNRGEGIWCFIVDLRHRAYGCAAADVIKALSPIFECGFDRGEDVQLPQPYGNDWSSN